MITTRDMREGHEELNLPIDATIDTPVYREAYRDLVKHKSTRGITYQEFLRRMRQRNLASRKKEFERRSIILRPDHDKLSYRAFKEMLSSNVDARKADAVGQN